MITNPSIQGALRDKANYGIWDLVGEGVPANGITGKNLAAKGSTYINVLTGIHYVNTGTRAVPDWKSITTAALTLEEVEEGRRRFPDASLNPEGLVLTETEKAEKREREAKEMAENPKPNPILTETEKREKKEREESGMSNEELKKDREEKEKKQREQEKKTREEQGKKDEEKNRGTLEQLQKQDSRFNEVPRPVETRKQGGHKDEDPRSDIEYPNPPTDEEVKEAEEKREKEIDKMNEPKSDEEKRKSEEDRKKKEQDKTKAGPPSKDLPPGGPSASQSGQRGSQYPAGDVVSRGSEGQATGMRAGEAQNPPVPRPQSPSSSSGKDDSKSSTPNPVPPKK